MLEEYDFRNDTVTFFDPNNKVASNKLLKLGSYYTDSDIIFCLFYCSFDL